MDSSSQKLRIAQICPFWEQVPPKGYGGIELIVSWLTEELVRRGHEVTLFASGDSQTNAALESPCEFALRHDPAARKDNLWHLNRKHSALEQLQLKLLYDKANNFDVIHSHLEFNAYSFATFSSTPTVHTLHMDLIAQAQQLFLEYADQFFISISDAQREPCPSLNFINTVYNAIDLRLYPFTAKATSPEYFAFLGRLAPTKGIHHAIEISKKTGIPLKFAGKRGLEDTEFFEEIVEPQIDDQQIQYLGEISHSEKIELLGQAIATLFPVTWREPFGLVMIESMACGTPVLGMNLGSVPEVIAHGKTGFVCDTVEEMVHNVSKLRSLDRQTCRTYVESRFSIQRMVDDYEACYYKALQLSRLTEPL